MQQGRFYKRIREGSLLLGIALMLKKQNFNQKKYLVKKTKSRLR